MPVPPQASPVASWAPPVAPQTAPVDPQVATQALPAAPKAARAAPRVPSVVPKPFLKVSKLSLGAPGNNVCCCLVSSNVNDNVCFYELICDLLRNALNSFSLDCHVVVVNMPLE